MADTPKRIGVLTSGGDCPGLNAVLNGLVRAAAGYGYETVGFHDGFEGLLGQGNYELLTPDSTHGIMQLGGTILGTTNKGHFVAKVRGGTSTRVPSSAIEQARATRDRLGLQGLVVIGGDGSLTTAQQLFEAGIPTIGVPKTIDNDLDATSTTFGFDSATACVTEALDRLHTTARSHKRLMVVEVMGRHAGWIALYGGLAGGADIILIPEIPFDFDNVAREVRKRDSKGHPSTLLVVAEGAKPKDGKEQIQAKSSGEYKLGGIGELVAREIARRTHKETRTCVLGHLQRGGAPTTLDRILGTRFGVKAAELVHEGRFGQMVSYQNEEVGSVPILAAVHRLRTVPPLSPVVKAARAVGITFGD
jgi:phosphofructokinase-like protein